MKSNYITSIIQGSGDQLWIGTRSAGIVMYATKSKKMQTFTEADGLISNTVRRLFYSSTGDLWIATLKGLSRWNGHYFENYDTDNGLYDNVIWNITEKNNQVYFMTRKGINRYADEQMQGYLDDASFFSRRVNTIRLHDDSLMYMGYSGYGVRIVNKYNYQSKWYSTNEGLTSDIIHDIVSLTNDRWLITSERGFDILCLEKEKIKSIRNFAKSSKGLGIAKTNPGAILQVGKKVWIGSKGGVYEYFDNGDEQIIKPPIIKLSKVTLISDDSEKYLPTYSSEPQSLKFSDNNLSIAFLATCFNDADNVTYQYKLTKIQEEWSLPSPTPLAIFTNLPSGEYVFEVRASAGSGVLSDHVAVYQFSITPPIWQRPWFYFLIALLTVALIRHLYLYRVSASEERVLAYKKIREEEALKVRKTMARDFHDNMGNQLASITVFSNLISLKLKNKTKEIDDLLFKIEKHSKSLYNGTKDFIWSMNPESDDLKEIYIYIKDFGEELYSKTEIEFYAEQKLNYSFYHNVPSGWSRQIVLIFKEALTNALKYSKGTSVHLSLQLDKKSFVLSCKDNGIGINEEDMHKGNGYCNMNSRAKLIGCNLQISNIEGLQVALSGTIPQKG